MCTQAWVDDMANYVKGLDPNHLVMVNSWGYFGASTPALVSENPTDVYAAKFTDTVLFPADRICHGEDSSAILSLPNIDIASMHIYPEYWSFCTSCAPHPRDPPLHDLHAHPTPVIHPCVICVRAPPL